uniref:RNase H type-1 domain-containing protein n=1 Tax=Lotus japonicus TaxID=34305 RepID=I3SSU1_LOTJA|nr:unknown [Lotus japonicus]
MNRGRCMAAATRCFSSIQDAATAKALGLRFAVETGFRNLETEMDCLEVVHSFNNSNNRSSHSYLSAVLDDCKHLKTCFLFFCLNHVSRNLNSATHFLAKFSLSHVNQEWIEDTPSCITSIVAMESYPSTVE